MKYKKKFFLLVAALGLSGSMLGAHCGACGGDDAAADHHHDKPGDVVAVASANDNFETLVAAVQAAGLVETLQGEGPFTIFAPTDEAFAALPEGTLEALLKPENRAQLVSILTYHVVPAKVKAADVRAGSAPTVNGLPLRIEVDGTAVMINGANVVQTDVMASNGIIHVIDEVMVPPVGDEVSLAD